MPSSADFNVEALPPAPALFHLFAARVFSPDFQSVGFRGNLR
jgi:hypothetical protein